jgi:nitrite reductase (NADH) small subunit
MTMSIATYNLGPVACIPLGEGRLFETGDTLIAIFRARDGRVYATEPWCPHRGGPLIDGIVAAGKVVCPLHGYTFDLATGKPAHNECRAIRTYPVRLTDQDEVLVTMRRGRTAPVTEPSDAATEATAQASADASAAASAAATTEASTEMTAEASSEASPEASIEASAEASHETSRETQAGYEHHEASPADA